MAVRMGKEFERRVLCSLRKTHQREKRLLNFLSKETPDNEELIELDILKLPGKVEPMGESAVIVKRAPKITPTVKPHRKQDSRFDGVRFDKDTKEKQELIKLLFIEIERKIKDFPMSMEKDAALMRLEESCLWIGKLLRNIQLKRNAETLIQNLTTKPKAIKPDSVSI